MNTETILKIFRETVNDYNTYSALYHMFYGSTHDIVVVGSNLFLRLSDKYVTIGNRVCKYSVACEAWKIFIENFDVSHTTGSGKNSLLIREGKTYYFYKTGEESPVSFSFMKGNISDVCYKCTIADVEKLDNDGDFRISSRFNYFDSFDVHIGAMKNDIVKMCTI